MAIASHAFLLVGAVATVFPFYWMLVTSLKTNIEATASPPTLWPQALQWGNYASAMASAPFGRYFLNTLLVATCQVTGVLVVASLAAFAFARLRFFGKEVIFTVFLATLMIPGEVTLIPNFVIVTRWLGWYDTYQAQFVPGMASVFAIFLLRQFFMQIPQDLEDAADQRDQLRVQFRALPALGAAREVDGLGVEAVPMYNLTRGPEAGKLFHDKGRGDGYVLTFGDKRVYLSGDTECIDEMKAGNGALKDRLAVLEGELQALYDLQHNTHHQN